jgi:hypothetical protein
MIFILQTRSQQSAFRIIKLFPIPHGRERRNISRRRLDRRYMLGTNTRASGLTSTTPTSGTLAINGAKSATVHKVHILAIRNNMVVSVAAITPKRTARNTSRRWSHRTPFRS